MGEANQYREVGGQRANDEKQKEHVKHMGGCACLNHHEFIVALLGIIVSIGRDTSPISFKALSASITY